MNEVVALNETLNARVSTVSQVAERLGLTGVYRAICHGYKPEHKAEYLGTFPRLQALRVQRDSLIRQGGVFAANMLDGIDTELQKVEAFMRSLTEVKWDQLAPNVVTTAGANLALDTVLAGSAYTVVGPYMGIIGAVTFTAAPVIADTMASHTGWTEAGATNAPTYTGPRKTIAWNAAAAKSKSPSAAPIFTFTGAGTAKGVFLVLGTGALSTIDNTAGTLYSAGLFTGGDQAVVSTNTVTVTYSATA